MQEIFDAIDQYADAYARLERLQRSRPLEIPIGDQKTGVIAEFFARIYARHRFPKLHWNLVPLVSTRDIKVLRPGQPELKVQVKAVSAHSQTSRVSPIHPGWHQLWLMRLDEHLRPHALWVVEAQTAAWSNSLLKNRTMPKLGNPQSGSAELRAGANETTPFLAALVTANPSFHRTLRDKAAQRR